MPNGVLRGLGGKTGDPKGAANLTKDATRSALA